MRKIDIGIWKTRFKTSIIDDYFINKEGGDAYLFNATRDDELKNKK